MIHKHSLVISILFGIGIIWILFLGYQSLEIGQEKTKTFSFEGVTRPQTYKESPTRGTGTQVTLYEYADFTCPGCASQQVDIARLVSAYGEQIQHVWKDFPFRSPIALDASIAGRCAHEQESFWEYHDFLFENQGNITPSQLVLGAQELGLDTDDFSTCLEDTDIRTVVQRDFAEGRFLGVNGTPTIVIGDTALVGVVTYQELEQALLKTLAQTNQ